MLAKSKEELEERLKKAGITYNNILEVEEGFWVFTPRGGRFIPKPRSGKRIRERLTQEGFPESVLQNLKREIDTKPVKVVNGYLKKGFWRKGFGLVFTGAPGVGKTHALIKAIAVLLRLQKVHQPVYIPFTELSNEEIRSRLDIYDAVLLDDINISLPEW
jgi:hypothetical protein